jgi:hypothetical protein
MPTAPEDRLPIGSEKLMPAVDQFLPPRGVLTFALTGLGLLVLGAVVSRAGPFPPALGYLALVAGVVLVLLYLARLVVLNPADPLVLGPALLSGFLLNPLLYGWLGVALYRLTPTR